MMTPPPRSSLLDSSGAIAEIELVPDTDNVITFSKRGFIKRQRGETFQVQGRGGRGACCFPPCHKVLHRRSLTLPCNTI